MSLLSLLNNLMHPWWIKVYISLKKKTRTNPKQYLKGIVNQLISFTHNIYEPFLYKTVLKSKPAQFGSKS